MKSTPNELRRRWAYTCSKMRIDDFGGGACLVRKGLPYEVIYARNYMEQLATTQKNENQSTN